MLRKHIAIVGITILAMAVEARTGFAEDPAQNAAGEDNLVRIENAKVKVAFVRPGVDWTKYKTIYLQPLSIPPEARDAAPNQGSSSGRYGESYLLEDKHVQVLKDRFDSVMRKELQKSKIFTLVTAPQADSIIIATELARLVLNAPIEETRAGYAGRGRTFSQGGGAATIAAAFADGGDYTILARVIDNRYAPDNWGVNNATTNLADLDLIYSRWGADIRRRLEEIHSGKRAMP